jgi:uncharacterized protein
MELVGWISLIFVGLSLGLLGSGGAILTVPILAYLFALDPVLATSYSLFLVGATAAVGGLANLRAGNVDRAAYAWLGLASVATVFVTRTVLLPSIPDVLPGGIPKGSAMLLLLATLMTGAAARMLWPAQREAPPAVGRAKLLGLGGAVGLLAGLTGSGGGFLLVPALALLARLPMPKAIGTSLTIIATQSLLGFAGDLARFDPNWSFLSVALSIVLLGLGIGAVAGRKVKPATLKPLFAALILTVAAAIVYRELISIFA